MKQKTGIKVILQHDQKNSLVSDYNGLELLNNKL